MSLYEIGRVCVKTMGREAGSLCVVIEVKDESFVVVTVSSDVVAIQDI